MDTRPFPLNAWYAAGWSSDFGRELVSRKICGLRMVFYRKRDGRLAALEDACWHRLVPLSLGKLDGDDVVCGYHGLAFDADGRCVHMPSQETINPSACVKAYAVEERQKLVWIWPGDLAKVDRRLIPDLPWLDSSQWAGETSTIRLDCDYRMVLDNLMDLTHETFVHAGSIGQAAVAEAPFTVRHTDRTVQIERWMLDIDAPPFLRAQLGKDGNVDRWQIINYRAPSTIFIDVGVALAGTGAPQGDRSQGITNMVVNVITPETDTSCFYLWSFPRNYRVDDRELSKAQRNGVAAVFQEDTVILTAQQKALSENPTKEYYNLNIDVGGMWVRRILTEMTTAEQSANSHDRASATIASRSA